MPYLSQAAPLVVACLMIITFMLGLIIGNGISCPCSVQVTSQPWSYISTKHLKVRNSSDISARDYNNVIQLRVLKPGVLFTYQDLENGLQKSKANETKLSEEDVKELFKIGTEVAQVYKREPNGWRQDKTICDKLPKFKLSYMKTDLGEIPVYVHNIDSQIAESGGIFKLGSWESSLQTVLLELLKEDEDAHFIDFGSNVGIYSLAVAKYGRKVISIDPFIYNIRRICSSVIVGNFTNNVTMIYDSSMDYSDTTETKYRSKTNERDDTNIETYHHSSNTELDDVLHIPGFNFKKAILKLDVPSREHDILQNGQLFFHKVQVLSVLINWNIARSDIVHDGKKIINFFSDRHFVAYNPFNRTQMLDSVNAEHWPSVVLWINKQT